MSTKEPVRRARVCDGISKAAPCLDYADRVEIDELRFAHRGVYWDPVGDGAVCSSGSGVACSMPDVCEAGICTVGGGGDADGDARRACRASSARTRQATGQRRRDANAAVVYAAPVRIDLPTLLLIVSVLGGCVAKGPVEAPREACSNHALDEVVSPSGNLKAVVFERRCGKPTAYSTQVALMPADGRLSEAPGNVLIAGNGGRVSRGRSFVTVAWEGPKMLRVTFAPDAAILRTEPTVGSVKVAYFRRSDTDGAPAGPAK
jgi:hypothetical protein